MPYFHVMADYIVMSGTAMQDRNEANGMSEGPAMAYDFAMPEKQPPHWKLKLGKDGRLVIPAAARALMALDDDGQVTATLEDGTLKITSPKTAWRRIDEIMKPFRDPSRSIVDEFIAEKRAEQAREDAEG
jgi:hypothetical protein